jgi:hypothetical protein
MLGVIIVPGHSVVIEKREQPLAVLGKPALILQGKVRGELLLPYRVEEFISLVLVLVQMSPL